MNRYETLFEQYVDELARAKKFADGWWRRLIAAEAARATSKTEAEERVRERWPMGPTGHPRVIAVYRKYFIACEQLNEVVATEFERRQQVDEEAGGGWGEEETTDTPADNDGASAEWGPESVMDPPTFLIDSLGGRRDDLANFMMFLVFSPIGEENNRSV